MQQQKSSQQSIALLDGIKVLDLSRILAGPWATQLLADYGATVWKIEKPEVGDDTRSWGPPFLDIGGEQLSAYFITTNRGKKSLSIDITKTEGQTLIKKLAAKADIVVENFKVGGLKQYGLDYTSLAKINPQLIYCSITGFGQTGPMADAPGYDAMIQAVGGLMSVTGQPDEEGGEPQKVGVAVTDLMAGMYAATAILAALNYRNSTGVGQFIDLALLDTQLAMLANQGLNYLVSGKVPQRRGNSHPNIVPYQTFRCSDGFLMLAVGNDQQFMQLCKVLEIAELAQNKKFVTNEKRVDNRQELVAILSRLFVADGRDNWLHKLASVNVPCGAVNNIAQALEHPQIQHREMQFELQKNDSEKLPQIANPVKFSHSPVQYKTAPPFLGEDTELLLEKELGLSVSEIADLRKTGVIE